MEDEIPNWDVPLGKRKDKPWGYERPVAEFQGVFLKELFLRKGSESSLHYHESKEELFYIVKGRIKVQLDQEEEDLEPGDVLLISPGQRHQIRPLEDTLILELGTRMFGDVIRIKDKHGRPKRE